MRAGYPKKTMCAQLIFISISANAWNPFGPNNFDDCIIQNMKGVTSDAAAASIRLSCQQKFPDKSKPNKIAEPTRYGYPRLDIWDKPYNYRVFNNITTGKFRNNNYGYELPVTNKNEFRLKGIYIGILSDKKSKSCLSEKSDYSEIYECSGEADPNTTKTFYCPAIQGAWCLVGFKADYQTDVDKFFRDISK